MTARSAILFALSAVASLLLPVRASACTTAVVSAGASASGRPMIVKVRDTSNSFNVVMHLSGPKYAYSGIFTTKNALAQLSGGAPECFGGVNTAGFAIMNNASYNRSGVKGSAESEDEGLVMAMALGTCRTVDDFCHLLDSLPKPMSIEANFGVVDAFGGAAYIECGNLDWTRFDVPAGAWLVRSNFSISGEDHKGSGYVRYETARHLMASHEGKFSAEFMMDNFGRCFENSAVGADMMRAHPQGRVMDSDLIARNTTVSTICVEGVAAGERLDGSVMWTALGYTPCAYSIPVWVAAGNDIPSCLLPSSNGRAPMNQLAVDLRTRVHTMDRDAAGKYVDFAALAPILKAVRSAEKTEFKLGRQTDVQLRTGFDLNLVKEYNKAADERFKAFEIIFK